MKIERPLLLARAEPYRGADHILYHSVKRRSYDNAVCEGALADH